MVINYESNTVGYLDITFGPNWDYIPLTRQYIENFLLVNMMNKENIHKVEIAASELLENAVKYSNKDGIRMIIQKSEGKNEIHLHVYNYVSPQDAKVVIGRVEEMNNSDPFEYYVYRMKESIKNKKEKSAGLGLARIYYEGQALITINHNKKEGILETKAIFNLN